MSKILLKIKYGLPERVKNTKRAFGMHFPIFKFSTLVILAMLIAAPAISAFEAHLVNVSATLAQIDPPILTPPGEGVTWDNQEGGNFSSTTTVTMLDPDPDASHIFYTFITGTTTPSAVPDPVCGQTGPNSGGGTKPQNLEISTNIVVKAVACNGDTTQADKSVINTKVYTFGSVPQGLGELVINEFLPNPTQTTEGNRGTAGASLDGEWVELYNNSASTIDVNGFVLYDKFVPTSASSSTTWTTHNDFVNPPNDKVVSASTTLDISGSGSQNANMVLENGAPKTGGVLMKFDAGAGNSADWQEINWTETENSNTSVCLQVLTSSDDITYIPVGSCVNSGPIDLSSVSNSRYLEWFVKLTRSGNPGNAVASVSDVTLNYNLLSGSAYHELVVTSANTNTGSTAIAPGGFLVVYKDGDGDFELNTPSNEVKLYNGNIFEGANLIDSYVYDFGGPIPQNKSFARVPDGSSNWVDPCPTPGEPNVAQECSELEALEQDSSSKQAVEEAPVKPKEDGKVLGETDPVNEPETDKEKPDKKTETPKEEPLSEPEEQIPPSIEPAAEPTPTIIEPTPTPKSTPTAEPETPGEQNPLPPEQALEVTVSP